MTDRLQSLRSAEIALRPYVPLVAQLTGGNTTLARIEPLMTLLGNPERKLRIIHVAGTSGKTSTSYFIAGMLRAADCKIGLTVSPHVDKISERVQINGSPISDKEFCAELTIFLDIVRQAAEPPSSFELLYAFSLWVFERQKVDYAVIETGMGGLHDATNVAVRPDKVCVITDIGYDHMHVLGHTLPEIALQKIGIMHPGNVGLTYQQSPEIMNVFKDYASEQSADLVVVHEDTERVNYGSSLATLPLYQQRNWLLAHRVYEYVANRDNLPHISSESLTATQSIKVPARMEIVKIGGKQIIMDGAHNEQKMTAFVASFQHQFPGVRPAVLIALKTGKEFEAVSPLLAELAATIIVTTFNTSQDLPAQSMDPLVLAQALRDAGAGSVQVIPDQRQAYESLMLMPSNIVIITGSFYLLSQLRSELAL
jgi:dihydrofolate synthase/folylpolyglutamate synthase